MTGRFPAARGARLAVVAALLAAAGCRHENPPTPVPVLHAIDVSTVALATTEGGEAAAFDVVLRSRPTAPVEVQVRSEDASEGLVVTPGYALPAAAGEITFTPDDWDVARRVTIQPVNDPQADGPVGYRVTVRVAFTEDARYAGVAPRSISVTNADDDAIGFTVSTSELTTFEAGTTPATFMVRPDVEPSSTLYLRVESTDTTEGLLSAAGVWSTPSLVLTFTSSSWRTPQAVTVTGQDDPITDGNRSYAVRIVPTWTVTGDPWAEVPAQVVTVTNVDDEVAAFTVLTPGVPLVTSEYGRTATFTVVVNDAPAAEVVIPVTSEAPGEALVSIDGSPPAERIELWFAAGQWSSPRTVTVVGRDDDVPGDAGDFVVTVGPPTGDPRYAALPAQTVPGRNVDNDVAAVSIPEAGGALYTDEWGAAATFTIVLNKAPPVDVVIPVTSGDATEGLLVSGAPAGGAFPEVSVTFTPVDWETPKTVTVVGQPDEIVDGPRTYAVTVGPPTGDPEYAALAAQEVTVTNADVSVAGLTVVTPSAYSPRLTTVEGGAPASFTVRLATEPAAAVVVPVRSTDPAEALLAGGDSPVEFVTSVNLTFTPADWRTPQAVQVQGQLDRVDDGDRSYGIAIAPAASDDPHYHGIGATSLTARNVDVDAAGLVVTPLEIATWEPDGVATFSVRLATIPQANVSFVVQSYDPSEALVVTPSDGVPAAYGSLAFTAQSWDVEQIVTVHGQDDALLDGSWGFSVRVAHSSGDTTYRQVAATISGTNADDEVGVDEGTPSPVELTPSIARTGQVGTGYSTYSVAVSGTVFVTLSAATDDVALEVDDDDDFSNGVLCASDNPGHGGGLSSWERCTVSVADRAWIRVSGGNTSRGAAFTLVASGFLASTDVPRAIPDASSVVVESAITVASGPARVSKVRVRVNVTHPCDSDLSMYLVAPSGTSIVLAPQVWYCGANFADTIFDGEAAIAISGGYPPYAGSYRPDSSFGFFDGQSPLGEWRLRVVDWVSGNGGTLNGWGLSLE